MHDAVLPTTFSVLLTQFQSCFTKPSYDTFVAMVTGWITCQGRHSISRVIQAAKGLTQDKDHSTFYRFFSRGAWSADSLARVLFHLLLPYLPSTVSAILDDTLCQKSGPHLFGGYMHYDASKSTYGHRTGSKGRSFFAFGHNWVVLAIWVALPWNRNRGLAIPILFRLYRGKKRCPKRLYCKRTQLAREMIDLLVAWLPDDKKLHVVGDNEYACATVMRDLPERVFFTGPLLMNAALYDKPGGKRRGRGRPRVKGRRLPSPSKLIKMTSKPWKKVTVSIYGKDVPILTKTLSCMWYTAAGSTWGKMVVTRDPAGRMNDRAYFTTQDEASTEDILVQYSIRWEIEVAFRNAKQIVGLGDPQNGWWRAAPGTPKPMKKPGPNPHPSRGQKGIVHTMAIAFTAYALIVLWYFQHGECVLDVEQVRKDAPWYRHKIAPSFADMVAGTRREIWASRLTALPLFRRVRQNIRELLPHWLLAA